MGLHNKELHNLYSSLVLLRRSIVKKDETGGICSPHGRYEKSVQFYRRYKRRWECSSKILLKRKSIQECVLDSCGSKQRPVTICCERSYELASVTEGGEFLHQLSDC